MLPDINPRSKMTSSMNNPGKKNMAIVPKDDSIDSRVRFLSTVGSLYDMLNLQLKYNCLSSSASFFLHSFAFVPDLRLYDAFPSTAIILNIFAHTLSDTPRFQWSLNSFP